jgi:DNA-binding response OmpR family regulator
MSGKRLLLVEDDPTLGLTLKERLLSENYEVQWAATAEAARKSLHEGGWDLVIFDVGLPDGSGFELAEEFKGSAPFLFVTALSDAEHRLQGFELGAEEYIPKPFHLKELLLRVRHVLESHGLHRTLKAGALEIDTEALTLSQNGEAVAASPKDVQLLALLVKKSPKVVTRDEILTAIWGEDHLGNQRTVDNSIVRLRSLFSGNPIRSVRGVGYQWTGENP